MPFSSHSSDAGQVDLHLHRLDGREAMLLLEVLHQILPTNSTGEMHEMPSSVGVVVLLALLYLLTTHRGDWRKVERAYASLVKLCKPLNLPNKLCPRCVEKL